MATPVQSQPWAAAMPYILAGIRAYAASHPGMLRAHARAGRSLVPSIIQEYRAYLSHPLVQAFLARWRATIRQMSQAHATPIVEEVVQSLQGEPGELGEVARTHPGWVRSELLLLADEVGRRL